MEISLSNMKIIAQALGTEIRLTSSYVNRTKEQDAHIVQCQYLLRNFEDLIKLEEVEE